MSHLIDNINYMALKFQILHKNDKLNFQTNDFVELIKFVSFM